MFSGTRQDRRGFAPSPQLTTEGLWSVRPSSYMFSLCVHTVHIRGWKLLVKMSVFSQGIMLVYDICNEKSFENIKNWIRNIEEVSSYFTWSVLLLSDRKVTAGPV